MKDDTVAVVVKKRCKPDNDTAAADKVGAIAYIKRSINFVARGEDCSVACGANHWFAL